MRRRRVRRPLHGAGLGGCGTPFPRRATDRAEDLAAWLLMSLALLAVVGALVVGHGAFDLARTRGHAPGALPVQAVLLADAVPAPTTEPGRLPSPVQRVPVAWSDGDGAERTTEVVVAAPLPAGAEVTVWVDRQGQPAMGPAGRAQAVAFGAGVGLTVAIFAWALLAVAWGGVQRWSAARTAAWWAREWARVEPRWSRRVP
jgi:hypothetical protein